MLWDVRLTARMLDAMRPLTERAPIATVVNTHSGGDHWWGNQLVAGAEIVATAAAADVMAEQSPREWVVRTAADDECRLDPVWRG